MSVYNNLPLIQELDKIVLQKNSLVSSNNSIDKDKLLRILKTQMELMSFLDKQYSVQMRFVLDQVAKHLTLEKLDALNKLGKINKTQELLMINSLEDELKKIVSECESLKNILLVEMETLKQGNVLEYKKLFTQELSLIESLRGLLKNDAELERNFTNNLKIAKSMDYSKFWSGVINTAAGLFAKLNWKIKLEGKENIVMNGPVIFASRHYHGDYDGNVLLSSIPRKLFILVGMDWIQSKFDRIMSPWVYKKMGAVPVNRPDSIFTTHFPEATNLLAMKKLILLLQSKEAVLIFPEAWPNIDSHYTPKKTKEEFLPLQRGFLFCLEEAQRTPREIPVVPIGLVYNESEKIITVNFGKPLYCDLTSKNRRTNKNADEIRKHFNDMLTEEIKRLSGL